MTLSPQHIDAPSNHDMHSPLTSAVQEAPEHSTSFRVNQLLQHLGHFTAQPSTESPNANYEDVTAFMSFFSHWIHQKFNRVTIEGMEHVTHQRHHIFMSNHRDILLDPALVNHALLTHGHSAARSVIGSNLMEDKTMASLMKMAGCLEVPRGNSTSIREKFTQIKQLSHQIQSSLADHNLWIAQREGRTKNGIDQTNPTVFKMIAMAKQSGQTVADFFASQSIIPVAISYQWDPSDTHKAMESYLSQRGDYDHTLRTDTIQHLIDSLDRCEGNIHICFGKPLTASNDITLMAEQLDQHIADNFFNFDSHQVAYDLIHQHPIAESLQACKEQLLRRIVDLPMSALSPTQQSPLTQNACIQHNLIQSYANSYKAHRLCNSHLI